MTIIQEYLLQILLIAVGLLIFLYTLYSLARKKLTESISMFWCTVAILFVVSGILLIPLEWKQYSTYEAMAFIASAFLLMVMGMFYFSLQISNTVRKTQELAIQISLLNQEHVKVDGCLSGLSGRTRNQLWRTNTVAEMTTSQIQEERASDEECAVCH